LAATPDQYVVTQVKRTTAGVAPIKVATGIPVPAVGEPALVGIAPVAAIEERDYRTAIRAAIRSIQALMRRGKQIAWPLMDLEQFAVSEEVFGLQIAQLAIAIQRAKDSGVVTHHQFTFGGIPIQDSSLDGNPFVELARQTLISQVVSDDLEGELKERGVNRTVQFRITHFDRLEQYPDSGALFSETSRIEGENVITVPADLLFYHLVTLSMLDATDTRAIEHLQRSFLSATGARLSKDEILTLAGKHEKQVITKALAQKSTFKPIKALLSGLARFLKRIAQIATFA